MDLQARLAQIRESVAGARAMPMSASCVINRDEMLGALDELAQMIPQALGESDRVLASRDEMIEAAHEQARQIVADGERRRDELVSDSDVFRVATGEAERMRSQAREETSALRREIDDYVDQRLASFEVTLAKTLAAVERGRERLRGRSELDTLGRSDDALEPLPGHGGD